MTSHDRMERVSWATGGREAKTFPARRGISAVGVGIALVVLLVACVPSRPHPPGLYTADEQGRLVVLLSGCRSYSDLRFDDRTDVEPVERGTTVWQLERTDPDASPTRIIVGEVPDGYTETLRDPRLKDLAQSAHILVKAGELSVTSVASAVDVEEPGVIHRYSNQLLSPEEAAEHFDDHCP